ncbi:DUF805 domain-containing protein [Aliiroseovarius sp. YM-037]|uniref:DUF805 domain-containing protein n=1 Tax=Aliiroseovarius sp. YM-037 TaxID=3341728 RepID=UPI003A7F7C36
MTGPATALENFIFKPVNVWSRATRAEYWWIIPPIWIAMLIFLAIDLNSIWASLLAREIPSLNPFNYGSFFLFTLTAIPRYALTVRRLHDSGRRAKWAFLPFTAFFLTISLLLGLGSAMLTTPGSPFGAGAAFAAVLTAGYWENIWDVLFLLAASAEGASMPNLPDVQMPETSFFLGRIADVIAENPAQNTPMLVVMSILVFGPFIAMGLFISFMLLPSQDKENAFGQPVQVSNPSRTGDSAKQAHNPFAAYAILDQPEVVDDAATRAARKREVKALYQSRVLGADKS